MMKKILSIVLKAAVSLIILYALFRNIDTGALWTTAASVNRLSVAFTALLFIATQSVSTLRWSIILKKDMEVSYPRLLSIYFIGMFFNNFLPTMVGGDLIKGYYLYKESGRGDVSLASIFMDRYSGFAALMVITLAALAPGYPLIKDSGLPAFFVALIGGFFAVSLVIWVGPLHSWVMRILSTIHFYGINRKIEMFYNVLMGYKRHYPILAKIFFCSVFVQGGVIIGYYILGRGLGMDIGIGYFFLFIPLTTAISMIPISMSGLGIREGAFVYLFSRAGASKEQALTLSLMWFVMAAVVSIAGGVEYIRMGGGKAYKGGEAGP
ncbi:MAG: flippase-like domain-containing protein [Deltaproteobacteria bacterium]|nr:flippase-like domain-containing protein [Deltaproteobacteria bacterium]